MKFATSISCIDGRVQRPVSNWILATYFVDFVDVITEPGPDKALSEKIWTKYLRSNPRFKSQLKPTNPRLL